MSPHVILFTGHRVDDADRATPRFPEAKVPMARQEIEAALDAIVKKAGHDLVGMAGAASGGDILFHEACRRRGIPTEVYLALPPDEYATHSVEGSGGDWMTRYHDLLREAPPRILQDEEQGHGTIWERTNLWMLSRALVDGGSAVTLLALWNGQSPDGPGGTKDMLDRARASGAECVVLGTGTIF
jgi:hypothetical protein